MINKIMNYAKKNKFVVMVSAVLLMMILFTILAYAVPPKYVAHGEMQEGYITSVDEKNFDAVYDGDYVNVRTIEEESWSIESEDVLAFNISNLYITNKNYIITGTDDVNAPTISCETLIYNNFSDQSVYDSLYSLKMHFRCESWSSISPIVFDSSIEFDLDNQLLVTDASKTTPYEIVFKITLNPSIVIDRNLYHCDNVILDGIEAPVTDDEISTEN